MKNIIIVLLLLIVSGKGFGQVPSKIIYDTSYYGKDTVVFISFDSHYNRAMFKYYDSLWRDANDSFVHYRPANTSKSIDILGRLDTYLDSMSKYIILWEFDNDEAFDSLLIKYPKYPLGKPINYLQPIDSLTYYEKQYKLYISKYTNSRNFKEINRYVDSAIRFRELIESFKEIKCTQQ